MIKGARIDPYKMQELIGATLTIYQYEEPVTGSFMIVGKDVDTNDIYVLALHEGEEER